jgi:hypothetical protein
VAITDLRNLLKPAAAAPLPAPTSPSGKPFSALADFHKAHIQAQTDEATRQLKINQARQKVAFYRKWLSSEGATIDKDGVVHVQRLVVEYDTTLTQQDLTRVRLSSGKLDTDDKFQKPLDTTDMVTHMSGPGKGIYVMSESGNLHVDSHVLGHRHHSSLLAGKEVACGGELKVARGRLTWISNKSGHYKPKVRHLLQVLHQLQRQDVDIDFAVNYWKSSTEQHTFEDVGGFLKFIGLGDDPDPELIRLMTCQKQLTPEVLESNGWRWHKDNEPIGVYRIDTNLPVDHKTARLWLKTRIIVPPPPPEFLPEAEEDDDYAPTPLSEIVG